MNEKKSCFFIGHREASEVIFEKLLQIVEQHITEFGVTDFYVGHYGGFDRLASHAVVYAKQKYPHITLTMLLPYHPTERPIEIPPGFDGTFYPSEMDNVPRQFAIARANRYMIDHVDSLIAYVTHPGSNSAYLLKYAQAKSRNGEITVTAMK